jgi:hypothetical protein
MPPISAKSSPQADPKTDRRFNDLFQASYTRVELKLCEACGRCFTRDEGSDVRYCSIHLKLARPRSAAASKAEMLLELEARLKSTVQAEGFSANAAKLSDEILALKGQSQCPKTKAASTTA